LYCFIENKLWKKIRGLDGNLKYDIDEILDEQINFYANLFSTEGWHNVSVFGFLSLLTLLIVAWRVQIYPILFLYLNTVTVTTGAFEP
jgi:hypothetical protein